MRAHKSSVLSVIVCFTGGIAAFWPFNAFGFNYVNALQSAANIKQVAIIGAGAAGASTAYHLQKFAKSAGVLLNITVFERSSYVGGRSTTVNAYNDPLFPIELGASIFIEGNKILKDAADNFGLKTKSPGSDSETLGIWNGEQFVFTQKDGGWAWWNTAKILWKYGLAPIRTQRLMQTTVAKFSKLYEPPFFPFRSLSDRALDLDLTSVTAITGEQFLTANKIGPPFTTDIIQASTRVNYGQNLGLIHGLETMVCMAIEGAMQIVGGNWQIFNHMVKDSGAILHLNTSVATLAKLKGKYILQSSPIQSLLEITESSFDTVVIAAPLQFSGIDISNGLVERLPDKIPYVKLHVTLFTSPFKLSGMHFNLATGTPAPDTILTTLSPDEDPSSRTNIVGKAGFFSISTLQKTVHPKTAQLEYLYKIFSPEEITSQFLSDILATTDVPKNVSHLITSPNDAVTWYYPFVWHSYPYEYPRVTFEDPELARGLYYTSGIESFISCMETSALMGMNVAQLVMDDYLEIVEKMNELVPGSSNQKTLIDEL